MKPNSVGGGSEYFLLSFPVSRCAMSISSTTFGQSRQESVSATQKSAGFVPPDFSYFSVFDQYQRYQEEAVASWPEANVTVGQIGGWRFYAEEASQLDH